MKQKSNTPVTVSMNGLERTFESALDALSDKAFSDLSENCGYSDTGGGWRDTYRRRYKAMVERFVSSGEVVVDKNETPTLSIRNAIKPKRNEKITRLVTKQGLVELNDNCYGSQISKINELAKEAKSDFPSLLDSDIEVVLFGGYSKKGIFGLHFKVPSNDSVPGDYIIVEQREKIQ